jgi:FixJ family two-component response regulator
MPSARRDRSWTVAIVDDDPAVGRALARLLQLAGFETREFESAECFLASKLEALAVPLILDVRMPGLDGPGLFRRLLAAHGAYPVIFISAVDDPRTCEEMRALGARGWLSKPVDSETLLALLGEPGGEPAVCDPHGRSPANELIGPAGPEATKGDRR